jgi:hypothetical protein
VVELSIWLVVVPQDHSRNYQFHASALRGSHDGFYVVFLSCNNRDLIRRRRNRLLGCVLLLEKSLKPVQTVLGQRRLDRLNHMSALVTI